MFFSRWIRREKIFILFCIFWSSFGYSSQEKIHLKKLQDIVKIKKRIDPREVNISLGGTHQDLQFKTSEQTKEQLCMQDETDFLFIQNALIFPWEKSWKDKNPQEFLKLLSPDFKMIQWNPNLAGSIGSKGSTGSFEQKGSIQQFHWENNSHWVEGQQNITQSLEKYLSSFSKIDDFKIQVNKVLSPRLMRDSQLSMKEADLFAHFDIRAIDNNQWRRQDRGELKIKIIKVGEQWKMQKVDFVQAETLLTDSPSFVEVTQELGVAQLPSYTRSEAIRRGGYALAIGDYNGDEVQDMFVGTSKEGQLLLGQDKGPFTLVKNSGIESETLVKSAVFADFFNTGNQDLLLVRFVPSNLQKKQEAKNDIVFYRNIGKGQFKKLEAPIPNRFPTDYAMPAAVADFNDDQFLDFYVGFPGQKDFTHLGNLQNKENLRVQGLFYNSGLDKFHEQAINTFGQDHESQRPPLFPHSAIAGDYDSDGDMDLIAIDDRGNLSPAYKNLGKGQFAEVAESIGIGNKGYGMGLALGDVNNDGYMDLAMTNVNFSAGSRIQASCLDNWSKVIHHKHAKDLRLFFGTKGGKFLEASSLFNEAEIGEGLAGVEFIDYNNDGRLDLYVTNGLWSGTDRANDLTSYFVMAMAKGVQAPLYDGRDRTQSPIMQILREYQGPVSSFLPRSDTRPSFAGFQRNKLFRNDGQNQFTEVGYLEGVDSLADGYIVAQADLNKDGRMDIVLRNGDPGSRNVSYSPVQIYYNQSQENNSLMVSLKGTESNFDGIGSLITAKIKDRVVTRHLVANNGAAQSQKIVHIGLNGDSQVDLLTVKWPNGKEQVLKNVPAGKITITETISSEISLLKK